MDPVKHKKLAAECARQGVATVSADLQSGWYVEYDTITHGLVTSPLDTFFTDTFMRPL